MTVGGVFKVTKDFNPAALARLKANLHAARNRVVSVGIPSGPTEADGTSLAMIGAVHEFGMPEKNIPERPWLHPSIIENRDKHRALNKMNLIKIMQGEMTVDEALGQLGNMAAGLAKEYVRHSSFPPLAQRTIDRKGSSTPLIDTGNMIQSITYSIGEKA